jgi:hypothetical protein
MNIRKYIFAFLSRKNRRQKYSKITFVNSIGEVPENLGSGIFIVQRGGVNRWAIFQCPCGGGERIEVNLMRSKCPNWDMKITGNKISLWPSIVVRDTNCRSHFCLRNNKVYWVKDR